MIGSLQVGIAPMPGNFWCWPAARGLHYFVNIAWEYEVLSKGFRFGFYSRFQDQHERRGYVGFLFI